jgi:outer membrane protein OmpA-like peptidoglycan-associated protein
MKQALNITAMKSILFLLSITGVLLTATAQNVPAPTPKPEPEKAPWCIDISLKPGLLNQQLSEFNTSSHYPNALNTDIGLIQSEKGRAFGFEVQLGYFFDQKRQYGIGTGLMLFRQTSDFTLNHFHIEYQSADQEGNIFRQSVTASQPVKETVKTTGVNIPVVFKYRRALTAKWGITADVGLVFNMNVKNSYSASAAFDYESIYKFDANDVAIYDNASVPDPNDWLITRAQYNAKNPNGDVNTYFNELRAEGHNVGLGVKSTGTSGKTSYKSGSVGFLIQPSATYKINEQLALNFGLYYLSQTFDNTDNDKKLTDKTEEYNSLTHNVSSSRNMCYGINIGVRYSFGKPKDNDKDGIMNKKDQCPDVAGLLLFNGCPDTDGDGIQDKEDACPQIAGPAQLKGCPDSDGDGIADGEDVCPDKAGEVQFKGCPDSDKDGVQDKEDQCPDKAGLVQFRGCPDSDADGVADNEDNCVNEKGTLATKGCPDADGDGVADALDKCPSAAGSIDHSGCPDTDGDGIFDEADNCITLAGVAANNGCPEVKQEVKQLFDKALQGIEFETGKAVIKSSSFVILKSVVKMMKENSTYKLVIEGHTDNVGDSVANMKISEERANAVAAYLIKNGVAKSRLVTNGYGSSVPLDNNDTEKGRARNRRVALKVEFLK